MSEKKVMAALKIPHHHLLCGKEPACLSLEHNWHFFNRNDFSRVFFDIR